MSDGFPDRLTQLRARWQGDPSSRVFLQLAEEYRHLGRVQEALAVLETGLKEHPGYLSALVAKGRCLLELGDPEQARGVLERVVQQDATQMVANKLLVRAYLETSDPERARQRLDLYSLLNDSDPEIEELRRRVVALSRPRRAPDEPSSDEPPERSRMEPAETPESEVFDLEPAAPSHAAAAEPDEDIFGLGDLPELLPAPAATATPTPSVPPPAAVSAPPAAVSMPPAAVSTPPAAVPAPPPPEVALAAPALPPRGENNGAEPFPDPTPEESRRLYLAAFEAEQIFVFEAGRPETAAAGADAAAPAAAASAGAPPEPATTAAASVAAPPVPAAPTAVPGAQPAAAAATIAVPVPLAAPAPTPDTPAPATVTLGELYLRQGHRQEAERIFRLVAEREPDNAAAHAALGRLAGLVEVAEEAEAAQQPEAAEQAGAAQQPEAAGPALQAVRPDHRPLDAAQLLAGLENPQAPVSLRKAYLLRRYLTRLRQARSPHVP